MCSKRIESEIGSWNKRECQMRCLEKNGCLGIIWGHGSTCGLCMNTYLEIGPSGFRFYEKPGIVLFILVSIPN